MRQQHAKYSNNLVRRSTRDRASNNTGYDIESGLIGERENYQTAILAAL